MAQGLAVLVTFLLQNKYAKQNVIHNTCAQLNPHACMRVPKIDAIRGLSGAAECCERCVQNSACNSFTFKVPGNESVCFLHAEVKTTKPGNCTSGEVHRTPSPSPRPSGPNRNILYVIVGNLPGNISRYVRFHPSVRASFNFTLHILKCAVVQILAECRRSPSRARSIRSHRNEHAAFRCTSQAQHAVRPRIRAGCKQWRIYL